MKCSDKEWQHCNKEKMGCEGCYYKDKIEIGEFVRNTFGDIYIYDYSGHPMLLEDKFYNRVVKHSKKIIDLVQKDDYVNGHLVIHKYTDTYYGQVILIEKALAEAEEKFLKNKDIKSVITAEQIKQIEFRIKE